MAVGRAAFLICDSCGETTIEKGYQDCSSVKHIRSEAGWARTLKGERGDFCDECCDTGSFESQLESMR